MRVTRGRIRIRMVRRAIARHLLCRSGRVDRRGDRWHTATGFVMTRRFLSAPADGSQSNNLRQERWRGLLPIGNKSEIPQ